MVRSKIATLVAVVGVLGVVFPSGVIEVLDLLPHISEATPVRPVGAVYFLAGGLVAWNVRTGRPNRSKHVVAIVLACAICLSFAFWVVGDLPSPSFFVSALCILFPLTAGSVDSAESIGLSAGSVVLLILAGMAVHEPSFANAMGDLSVVYLAAIWIAFGLPLYAVGREWRMTVPNEDGRSAEPA